MKIIGTGPLSDCVLDFNGHPHKLHIVMAKASSALVVDIKLSDIDINQSLDVRPDYHEVDGLEPAVIKHGGKYLILLGRDRLIEQTKDMVRVRLITSVALKDARIVKAAPAPAAASAGPGPERTRTFDHISDRQSRPQASYPNSGQRTPPRSLPSPYPKKNYS